MKAFFANSWKKKACSFLLALALMSGMTGIAGAQTGPSLHTETVAFPEYRQSETATGTTTAAVQSLLLMNTNEKQAEAAIAQALMSGSSRVDLQAYGITRDQLLRILNYNSFTDYPQITGVVAYEYTVDAQDVVYGLWPQYNASQAEIAAKTAQIEQAAQAVIASAITSNMTQLQQIVAIHDYLVLNCTYDTRVTTNSAPHDSFTAYGALVNRTAVCQGYAAAFQLLTQKLGISGIVVQSTAMNHAWNMVFYNDQWYHVDVTWDDPVPDQAGKVQTNALLKSDSAMMNSINQHYSWDSAGYVATSTQFDNVTDWSQYRIMHTAIATGAALDSTALAGTAGSYYEFLVKPYQSGTQITVSSSNPAVASVQLVNANDPRGAKYRVVYQGAGTATVLITTGDGGIKTLPATVQAAALAA